MHRSGRRRFRILRPHDGRPGGPRTPLLAALLSLFLIAGLWPPSVFTSLPQASAANETIVLDGFGDLGKTPETAVLYGNPTITLSGSVAANIDPSGLRLRITNQGQTEDLASVKPIVDGTRFTFRDVPLRPDLNTIVFYDRQGVVERTLLTFYVRYNDTPLITELRVNDQPLSVLEDTPAIVTLPNPDRLTLYVDGRGVNLEQVWVKNNRTGDEAQADAVGGTFSVRLSAKTGENVLTFRAVKNNKEVVYLNRTVIVTLMSDGGDLLYDVRVGTGKNGAPVTTLSPDADPTQPTLVPVNRDTGNVVRSDDFSQDLQWTLALDISNPDRRPVTYEIVAVRTKPDGTQETYVLYRKSGTPLSPDATSGTKALFYAPANAASVAQDVDGNSLPFDPADRWALSARYWVEERIGGTWTLNPTEIAVKPAFFFRFVDASLPRFLAVTEAAGGKAWTDGGTVSLPTLPFELLLETRNMLDANGAFDATRFDVLWNGTPLASGTDYSWKPERVDQATQTATVRLTLQALPGKSGTLTFRYVRDPNDPSTVATFSVRLNLLTAPYVALTADLSGPKTVSVDRALDLKQPEDLIRLFGRVYNYPLGKDNADHPTNLTLTLNGVSIPRDQITIGSDGGVPTFTVDGSVLTGTLKLAPGNNLFVVRLDDVPEARFQYEIRVLSGEAPMIQDIVLKTEQDGKAIELRPSGADNVYRTNAAYLRELSFRIPNPQDSMVLTITKNGRAIGTYRYDAAQRLWQLQQLQTGTGSAYQAYLDELKNRFGDAVQGYGTSPNYHFPQTVAGNEPFSGGLTLSRYRQTLDAVKTLQNADDQDAALALLPFTLRRSGQTIYVLTLEDTQSRRAEATIVIERAAAGWKVLAPLKAKPTDPYPIVNSNAAVVKVFAEKATKVLIGKEEAKTSNTTKPDFVFNEKLGDEAPETYYVFTATVPLKPGLNKIPLTLTFADKTYKDEVLIYNANAPITGAEYYDTLGKKTSFTAFNKAVTLTFPKGTVLLKPPPKRFDDEVIDRQTDLYTDVPLYFGLANRTTGEVTEPGSALASSLILPANFIYASPLYYIDAGDVAAPGGRDPYLVSNTLGLRDFRSRAILRDNLIPSQRGTLTLAYDPSIVQQAANQLTVFYHDGTRWQNIGGVVDPKKHTITVPFKRFGYYMVMKLNQSFADVVNHPFAQPAMETMYAKGIMPNFSSSSFGAYRPVSRGELASDLVRALDLPINAGPYEDSEGRYPLEPSFYDVRPSGDSWDYAYRFIETAARAGIVSGKQPGYYYPDADVTRQEAAVMIARAMNLKLPATPEAAQAILAKQFTDVNQMHYYALQAIAAVTKAGLMQGSPVNPNDKKSLYTFNPRAPLTRAEMAVILQKMMVQLKKLPK
ncbi:MAG: S-layer homology domain-containing protein [Hydrogenibacillus schlegelii]|uniref:S-layer homology domain-containing protein n=1 Tax=Hydrogenibacillus schlegelii TaxID=1484 RepID=A0A947CV71_HYDSH|nr:S-layer homology domain-containing protein [Hydrogenibacillus schlegelii]MBT9283531.1 S-layer homology domain-containing protein [Hydrogenibacillus schlegelii]